MQGGEAMEQAGEPRRQLLVRCFLGKSTPRLCLEGMRLLNEPVSLDDLSSE